MSFHGIQPKNGWICRIQTIRQCSQTQPHQAVTAGDLSEKQKQDRKLQNHLHAQRRIFKDFIEGIGKRFYSINNCTAVMRRISIQICVVTLKLYKKWISPILPGACRFYPTCSEYSAQSIQKFGICKGISLSIKRLCKCHPFHPGGFDPVP
jgi:uncharacterized protein